MTVIGHFRRTTQLARPPVPDPTGKSPELFSARVVRPGLTPEKIAFTKNEISPANST
jgi:hypothetical protein